MKKEKLGFIENKINQKALDRFDADLLDAINLLKSNPILSELAIYNNYEKKNDYSPLYFKKNDDSPLYLVKTDHYQCREALFRESRPDTDINKYVDTNINDIKANLIKKYQKEEGDKLLSQLDIVGDYLNQ